MKPSLLLKSFIVLSFLAFMFAGSACQDELTSSKTYRTKVPVFMTLAKLRSVSTVPQKPQQLGTPGKIYVYGNYLFINEINKGIHIVDNLYPNSPRFINFIPIPGNADMAVNNNVLYADCTVDLVAFDITNPAKIKVLKRVEDVFTNIYEHPGKGIIIDYKDTTVTSVEKIYPGRGVSEDAYSNSGAKGNYGQGGSTARFTLMNNYLYTVGQSDLKLFNVSNAANPQFVNKIDLDWGIETIFPYDNKLFIGSTRGMHIYDASNPSAPVWKSTYQHVTSCDPVVVDGKYAYVTLRSGNFCQQGINVLQVLDVEDVTQPKLVSSFPMQNPHGLGLAGSNLFICEGEFGLKSFNATDVMKIGEKQLQQIKDIHALDLIPTAKSLIVTGPDGIYQYDYSNPAKLKLLSKITIKKQIAL